MSTIVAKSLDSLTQEELTWIASAAALGLKFIDDGASVEKLKTIFSDILYVTTPAAEPAKTEETSEAIRPLILCSQCREYLPNIQEYNNCLLTCTN